jgi:hypothetical protein
MANHDVRRIKKVPATSCTQNFSTPMIAEVNSLDFEAEIAHVVEDRRKTMSVGAKGKGRQPNLGVPAKKMKQFTRDPQKSMTSYTRNIGKYQMEIPRFSIVL